MHFINMARLVLSKGRETQIFIHPIILILNYSVQCIATYDSSIFQSCSRGES